MDLKLIQRLITLMKRGDLVELDVEDAPLGLKVHLRREGVPALGPALVHVLQGGGMQAAASHAPAAALAPAPAAPPPAAILAGKPVESPMIGTFYRSASPDSPPFAQVGQRIAVDQTLCIIEAMKVMNEIKAEFAGEVVEVLVENGQPVEFGQPLFLVKTS